MNSPTLSSEHQIDPSDDEISLSDMLDLLLQHIWLILGIFIVSLGIGVAYAVFATPIFQADSLIQVEDKKGSLLGGVQDIANALGTESSPVSGEIEILGSREVVMQAIAATHADLRVSPIRFPLIGNWYARSYEGLKGAAKPFLGLKQYAWGGEVLQLDEFTMPERFYGEEFRFRATDSGYNIEDSSGNLLASGVVGKVLSFDVKGHPVRAFVSNLIANEGTVFKVVRSNPITAYKNIASKLSISEVGKQSSVIQLSYQDPEIDYAQSLVNAISTAYLKQNVERKSAEADQSLKFLNEQLPQIKQEAAQAEDALSKFRTRTNTVSVEAATRSLLIQSVDVEKTRLELQLKRNELAQSFKPDHPMIKTIEAQLADTTKEADKVTGMVNQLPIAQRDLLRLQRDVEVDNQLYVAMLNNAQQLKVAKAGTTGNVRVIDFAVIDKDPVAPKTLMVIALASLVGIILGIGAALVSRLLRPTVRNVDEVERATGLVSYANVPESISQEKLDSSKRDKKGQMSVIEGRTQLLAELRPDDPAIESLRSLRTGLIFALMGAADKNIVITSATAALGKSFISANLSVLLASTGKRILLIETDMRRPQLGAYFGYTKMSGLSDLLVGAATFDSVVRRNILSDGVGALDVLSSGQIPPNPGELLMSSAFSQLVLSVQDKYDHIILDSAPVLPVGDTLAVAQCASTTFLIVRAEVSTVGEVRDAMKKLESVGVTVKGMIFNGVKRRRVGYGYAYKYHYGYGSK